ncbi:MAG: NmrA family NAD(P)-binding protein [Acidobacteriaceae bacterium]|nr:NmrA family NAD(P)-binding protein [Acidobacteriaceae bacterium]
MFFIAGLTGHVGGAAARQLLARGKQVRTVLRTPEKAKAFADQGVEIRQGDLNDAELLAHALEGVEGAFLLMQPTLTPPPDFSDAKASLGSYTAALAKTPVPRLVALSSMGSEKTEKLGNITSTSLMERAFSNLPFPTAFVRAGSFYENYARALQTAQQTGKYFSFQPVDLPFPSIGSIDIGNLVAELLLDGWTGKKVIELGSLTTAKQMAAAISKVLNRTVDAQAIPRQAWAETLQHFGLPPGSTGPYEQMMDSISNGWITFGQPGTEAMPATQTPEEFFAKLAKQ